MISYQEALTLIEKRAASVPLSHETLSLLDAGGRVLARTLHAERPVPSFASSAMDGFALRAEWVAQARKDQPVTLAVTRTVFAGDQEIALERGRSAVEIMTGAMVPDGLDCIVKVEDVVVERDAGRARSICCDAPARSGQNLRPAGEDYAAGGLILARGAVLSAEASLSLAAAGIGRVEVVRRPRVAVISTGNELRPANGAPLPAGCIYDSNSIFLGQELARQGCELVLCERVPDDPTQFLQCVGRAEARGVDMVISTGAVSAGVRDFVPEALRVLGCELLFHQVAMRPGKPIAVARKGPVTYFALPGNSVSAAVGARFFVSPFLRLLRQQPSEPVRFLPLVQGMRSPPGMRQFVRASHATLDGRPAARADASQGSHVTRSLARAELWVIVSEDRDRVEAGEPVAVVPVRDTHEDTHAVKEL